MRLKAYSTDKNVLGGICAKPGFTIQKIIFHFISKKNQSSARLAINLQPDRKQIQNYAGPSWDRSFATVGVCLIFSIIADLAEI